MSLIKSIFNNLFFALFGAMVVVSLSVFVDVPGKDKCRQAASEAVSEIKKRAVDATK